MDSLINYLIKRYTCDTLVRTNINYLFKKMTTKNPRINVTFEENLLSFLFFIAKQEQKSLSSIVKELAIESLERREDKQLSQIASELDQPNVKTYSHFDAWK